jgi:hypothetical protein
MTSREAPSIPSLILVPSLITLGVTLLRLVGELNNWAPALFSRQAGGAASLVGIVWLAPVFGAYFAWRLARAGSAPAPGRVAGHALLAFLLPIGAGVVLGALLHLGTSVVIPAVMLAGLVGAWLVWRAWPLLGRALFLYGVAARVPVIVVMLIAMLQDWGTHYDVPPPNFPAGVPVMAKWFQIGVMPQLFLWIPYTMLSGALLGGIALVAVRSQQK